MGTGSGVIISDNGYIVTNNHVIARATEINVTMNNNKTYQAEVVGTDPSSDIALIKIEADEKLFNFVPRDMSDDIALDPFTNV